MGRPQIQIDLAELEKLYGMQCTDEEAAAFLGIALRTLQRRLQRADHHEVKERGLAKGRVSIRRNLFKQANAGNVAAAIFLAKNVLGYRDVVANEHSGPGGGAIEFASKPDYSNLSDEELRQLRILAAKAQSLK